MPVRRICGTCGVEFFLVPAKVSPVNYCSRQCFAKSVIGRVVPQEQRDRQRAALRGRANPRTAETNRQRTGERHPRWRGDAPNKTRGRHRAMFRFPAQPCEVCGEVPVSGTRNIHRHHKDRNPMNNERSNIAFLCRGHHAELHRALRAEVG